MHEEINAALAHAAEGMNRYHKIDTMLEDMRKREGELLQRCELLESKWKEENKNVKRVTGVSLVSLLASLRGNREACIDKEQREALAAELKLSQCQTELADLRHQMEQLLTEQATLKDCTAQHEKLYKEKQRLLESDHSPDALRIAELSEEITKQISDLKEIREALSAGRSVVSCLESIESSLDSASSWGVYDILGGGLVADLAKHSHIDEARNCAETAQRLLGRFRTELADVKINSQLNIGIDSFAKFADFFFDGLISDWFIQSKIKDSRESVERVKGDVQQVLWKLGDMLCASEKSKQNAEQALHEFVVHAK